MLFARFAGPARVHLRSRGDGQPTSAVRTVHLRANATPLRQGRTFGSPLSPLRAVR